MSEAHAESHADDHGDFHVVPVTILAATGSALILLTVITVLAAKVDFAEWDLKELNIWIALAIATVKASLVCLFFMHLRYDRPFNAFVFVGSVAFVALFIGFAMTDTFAYRDQIEQYQQVELAGGETPLIQETLDTLIEPSAP